jgi:hypothetical protein
MGVLGSVGGEGIFPLSSQACLAQILRPAQKGGKGEPVRNRSSMQ